MTGRTDPSSVISGTLTTGSHQKLLNHALYDLIGEVAQVRFRTIADTRIRVSFEPLFDDR